METPINCTTNIHNNHNLKNTMGLHLLDDSAFPHRVIVNIKWEYVDTCVYKIYIAIKQNIVIIYKWTYIETERAVGLHETLSSNDYWNYPGSTLKILNYFCNFQP
jgi:hypothetical protein